MLSLLETYKHRSQSSHIRPSVQPPIFAFAELPPFEREVQGCSQVRLRRKHHNDKTRQICIKKMIYTHSSLTPDTSPPRECDIHPSDIVRNVSAGLYCKILTTLKLRLYCWIFG